jgi:aspartyl-tRNA(Asn)/glutamyl-tRNA(Gln) amidotransferase subunit A
MVNPADLGVRDATTALRSRELSSRELVEACLARIREHDGTHSYDGDPESINAWVRVYEEDALEAAARADERLARSDAPALCGIPIGLKDLYAVAGKPLTASSRALNDTPERDCDVWQRLRAEGMVLLGHVHTHEFGAGGTTDQVGNPWSLELSAGGSSAGSSAALAARMVPTATGTDTAGSVRIPSAMVGTSALKPTRGRLPLRGIVPLCPSLDHPGPMARTVRDCEALFAAMAGATEAPERRSLARIAVSPRIGDLHPDVADGLDTALAALEAERVDPAPPAAPLDLGYEFTDLVCTDMLPYHRQTDLDLCRPFLRDFIDYGEQRAMTGEEYVELQSRRAEHTAAWCDWLAEHRIDAVVEPTVPIVARQRGNGYEKAFTDYQEISLTHYWDWTGLPAVALPSGVGARSGLPTSVSLIGAPYSEWHLLDWGAALQEKIGTVSPP